MTTTIQDRYIGITKLENKLQYVNNDKTTKVCASDIAQFIDEFYPEFFEFIASDEKAYNCFNERLDNMNYYSFGWIASEYLADNENFKNYDSDKVIAEYYGYETLIEMMKDCIVFCDAAIDGYLVIG